VITGSCRAADGLDPSASLRAGPRGARPHTYLEAVDDANTYVVIVLPASPGINVQSWSSGVEVARFDPRTPSVPWIHIQSRSELDDTGVGATWSGVP